MENKAYLVKLSNSADVSIDADEVDKLLAGVSRGSMVRVRQGLINPSFIVAVVPDKERIREFLEKTKYDDEESKARRNAGMEPLRDIFADVLPLSAGHKQIA